MLLLANPSPFWTSANIAYAGKLPLKVMRDRWKARIDHARKEGYQKEAALAKICSIWEESWKSLKCKVLNQDNLDRELHHLFSHGQRLPALMSALSLANPSGGEDPTIDHSPAINGAGRVELADLFLVSPQQVTAAVQGDNDAFVGRTAWYGDALFHVDASTVIFRQYPAGTKGQMTRIRQTLESNSTMKTFLLEGTDVQEYLGKNLSVHAVGSAFECLYCQATPTGRARALQYFLHWIRLHKHPDFLVLDKIKSPGQPEEEIWGWHQSPSLNSLGDVEPGTTKGIQKQFLTYCLPWPDATARTVAAALRALTVRVPISAARHLARHWP